MRKTSHQLNQHHCLWIFALSFPFLIFSELAWRLFRQDDGILFLWMIIKYNKWKFQRPCPSPDSPSRNSNNVKTLSVSELSITFLEWVFVNVFIILRKPIYKWLKPSLMEFSKIWSLNLCSCSSILHCLSGDQFANSLLQNLLTFTFWN